MFQHPSGYQVEAKEEVIRTALEKLHPLWPRGLRIGTVFPDIRHVMDDLHLLHRNGLIELRCIEPAEFDVCPEPLNKSESRRGYTTSPYHTREDIPTEGETDHKHSNTRALEEHRLNESMHRKDLLLPYEPPTTMGAIL